MNPLLPQISKANFTKLIYTSLQNSLQVINNITINITDIDWSFIKVPTINQNLLTHKQMHRCITTFIQWLLFDSTIILNYSFVSRARSWIGEWDKTPLLLPKMHPFHSALGSIKLYNLVNVLIKCHLVKVNIMC